MLTYLGELSIGVAVPGANSAVIAGLTGINAALPNILAQLEALSAFAPTPIDFAAQLTLANSIVTSVQAGITAGLPIPSMADQIAAVAALVAALLAQVSLANAQVVLLTDLQAPLAVGGLHAYAYAGPTNGLGSDVDVALAAGVPGGSGPSEASNALVLVTVEPATWSAVSVIFKVTP